MTNGNGFPFKLQVDEAVPEGEIHVHHAETGKMLLRVVNVGVSPAAKIAAAVVEIGHQPRCKTGICRDCEIAKRIEAEVRKLAVDRG